MFAYLCWFFCVCSLKSFWCQLYHKDYLASLSCVYEENRKRFVYFGKSNWKFLSINRLRLFFFLAKGISRLLYVYRNPRPAAQIKVVILCHEQAHIQTRHIAIYVLSSSTGCLVYLNTFWQGQYRWLKIKCTLPSCNRTLWNGDYSMDIMQTIVR